MPSADLMENKKMKVPSPEIRSCLANAYGVINNREGHRRRCGAQGGGAARTVRATAAAVAVGPGGGAVRRESLSN